MSDDCRALEQSLPDLLDGRRVPEAEVHLASCAACRARLRDLATTTSLVADLADEYRPVPDAEAALERALYARLSRRPVGGVNPGWLAVAALAGAVLTWALLRPSSHSVPSTEPPLLVREPVAAATSSAPEAERRLAPAGVPRPTVRRFREAVARAKQAPAEAPKLDDVLDAYREAPEEADAAISSDPVLGGYYAEVLQPRLLRGTVDRATTAIDAGRWLEGCEDAHLARRLDKRSEAPRAIVARCEEEAARITEHAATIEDPSARRTMLRGALLLTAPDSPAHRAIEERLATP